MKTNGNKENPKIRGLQDLQKYAQKHNCEIIGEYRICRVIKNTRHGRKETICGVVRACKRNKLGEFILGYLIGLTEIEFKPDVCKYVFVAL